jgi:hypothetical protein
MACAVSLFVYMTGYHYTSHSPNPRTMYHLGVYNERECIDAELKEDIRRLHLDKELLKSKLNTLNGYYGGTRANSAAMNAEISYEISRIVDDIKDKKRKLIRNSMARTKERVRKAKKKLEKRKLELERKCDSIAAEQNHKFKTLTGSTSAIDQYMQSLYNMKLVVGSCLGFVSSCSIVYLIYALVGG